MTDKFNHIDKLLREKVGDFQVKLPENDAAKFQKRLKQFRFLSFNWNSFNIYYTVGLVGIIACCLLLNFDAGENTVNTLNQHQTEKSQNIKQNDKQTNKTELKIPVNNTVQDSKNEVVESQSSQPATVEKSQQDKQQETAEEQTFTEKSTTQQNNSSAQTEPEDPGQTKNVPAGNQTKVVIFDTIQTEKKIIVYDTVKTVIKVPVDIGKKKRRRRH